MNLNRIKILFIVTLLITSCSHGLPLNSTYTTPTNKTFLKAIKPTTISIKEFEDERAVDNYKVIGNINEVVADISSNELTLDKEASIIVTKALKKEFNNSGFTLSDKRAIDKSDLTLSGIIKEFELNIDDTDSINIKIEYQVIRNKDNKVIFSGLAKVKDSRFIGVTGNTRKSINEYLNMALYNISKQIISSTGLTIKAQIETPLKKDEIDKFEASPQIVDTTLGTVTITGTPLKVKVYIDEIYYGLTPISIKLKPGIYSVSFKKKGFKEEKEKISVREKAETILEIELESN